MRLRQRLRRWFSDGTVEDQIAAERSVAADLESSNPDTLAKLQRGTPARRSAWNALTHRSINTEWRGD